MPIDRKDVMALHKSRHRARRQLRQGVEQARHDLTPKNMLRRWSDRQKVKIEAVSQAGSRALQKNAPFIGLAGAAILLFAVRKPISDLYQKLRSSAPETEEQTP